MSDLAEQALIRILKGDGSDRRAAGAGWLISPRRCLTDLPDRASENCAITI